MSAVVLAVFGDFKSAERARVALFHDGFPTDRVELTAGEEPGAAALEPAPSPSGQLAQYFHVLFEGDEQPRQSERLARLVLEHGAATLAVLPRGQVEVRRAIELLSQAHPEEMLQHDLGKHALEGAASRHEAPWIRIFRLQHRAGEPDCIYCRLFPGSPHETHSH